MSTAQNPKGTRSLLTIYREFDPARYCDRLNVGDWFDTIVTDHDLREAYRTDDVFLEALAPAFLLRTPGHEDNQRRRVRVVEACA